MPIIQSDEDILPDPDTYVNSLDSFALLTPEAQDALQVKLKAEMKEKMQKVIGEKQKVLTDWAVLLRKLVVKYTRGEWDTQLLRQVLETCPDTKPNAVFQIEASGINLTICHACYKHTFKHAAVKVYGGRHRVCPECFEKFYIYCEKCSSYKLITDVGMHIHSYNISADESLIPLKPYNDSISHYFPDHFLVHPSEPILQDTRFLGVELEVEYRRDVPIPPDIVLKAQKLLPDETAICVRDGSLSCAPLTPKETGTNGFELVTVPMTLKAAMEIINWHRWFDTLSPWLDREAKFAALHVHVSAASISKIVLGRAIKFFNAAQNLEFLEMLADRVFTTPNPNHGGKVYAKVWPSNTEGKVKELISHRKHSTHCPHHPANKASMGFYIHPVLKRVEVDGWGHKIIQGTKPISPSVICHCPEGEYTYFKDFDPVSPIQCGHYAALNVYTKKPTVEIRIYRSSLDVNHFLACLQFSYCIFSFCAERGFNDMTWQQFLEWFRNKRKQYPNLSSWLEIHGLLPPRRGKK